MPAISKSTTWQIARLGLASGMRTMAAPASLAARLSESALAGTPFAWLRITPFPIGLQLLAGAELVADKLPTIPARTEPLGLVARIVAGGFAGAVVQARHHEHLLGGALLGSLAAVTSTFTAYYARRALTHEAGVPDPLVAVAEDALAYGIARHALDEGE